MREKMEAYLDNSATTKVFDSVREIVMKTMEIDYGNPSALHRKGVEAEKYMKDASAFFYCPGFLNNALQ